MEVYIEKFEAMHNTIYNLVPEDDIDILSGEGINMEYIEKYEKEFNITLPKDLKEYYYYFNHQRVIWSKELVVDGQNMVAKGHFETLDIENALAKKAYFKNAHGEEDLDFFWPENLNEETIQKLNNYFPFDDLGLGYFTLFTVQNNSYSLHLFEPNGEITPLKLDIYQYMDYVLDNYGLNMWTHFIKENTSEHTLDFYNTFFISQLQTINKEVKISNYKQTEKELKRSEEKYTELWDELQNTLVNNENIMIPHIEKNPPIGILSLLKSEQVIGFSLPKEIKEFYLTMNGFEFSYFFDEETYIEGNARILKLEELMGGLHGTYRRTWGEHSGENLVWQSNFVVEDPSYVEAVQNLKVLEYITPTLFLCVKFDKVHESYNLYLCQYDDPMRIELSFEEYIQTLFDIKGIQHWQYYYTHKNDFPSLDSLNHVQKEYLTVFRKEPELTHTMRTD